MINLIIINILKSGIYDNRTMCHDSYHFHVTLLNMMEEQKCCPCLPDLPQTISNVDLSLYKIFDQTFEKIVSIFFYFCLVYVSSFNI